jgi:DnaJ-class molecular chaperone
MGRGRPGGGASYGPGPGGQGYGGSPSGYEEVDLSQFFGERFGEGGGEGGGFADIFNQFRRAGGGGNKRGATAEPKRGADIVTELQVPFTVAVLGGEAQISLRRKPGNVETITVKIPPGIDEGKKIRLRGQGEGPPRGGTPGDLLITIHVTPHPYFQRRGNNLEVRVPVTLREAAEGAKVDVPTPKGTITLRIPSGTSSGTKLRVKGHGVPTASGEGGDLFAQIEIVIPKKLDDESLESIRKLDEHWNSTEQQQPRRDLKW